MSELKGSIAGLVDFRCQVHASFSLRADALSALVEAVLWVPRLASAVRASLAPVFRRRHCSVPDALENGCVDRPKLRQTLMAAQAEQGERIGGYELNAIDITKQPRPDADTAEDRGYVYSAEHGRAIPAWQFCWLGRVIATGLSWFAPLEVDRIPTDQMPAEVAADQVKQLAKHATKERPKVVAADSGFAWPTFLLAFVALPFTYLLLRIANNRVLFGPPPPPTGKRGHPRRHGDKFRLIDPPPPERSVEVTLLGQTVQLSAWHHLHFEKVHQLVGLVVRVVFLKEDRSPRYKRPLWLFWTGPQDARLEDLALMYLMRFTIEHFFRFLKQCLGLEAAHSPNPKAVSNWVWVVALAYWHLLLARQLVTPQYHDWDPKARRKPHRLTPGQVLQAWVAFSAGLEPIADPPKPAGKGRGRALGFKPKPRQRHPVVSKKQVKAEAAT